MNTTDTNSLKLYQLAHDRAEYGSDAGRWIIVTADAENEVTGPMRKEDAERLLALMTRELSVSEFALARVFAHLLKQYLASGAVEPGALEQINLRNAVYATNGEDCCASHDFCDPNQIMLDAMDIFGIALDTQSEAQCDWINAAWGIAKVARFWAGEKPVNAD